MLQSVHIKNIKYTSLSVQKRLQVELKQYRTEALRVMVEQNEEVKNIEKENLFCCQKLSTVTKENQRYAQYIVIQISGNTAFLFSKFLQMKT